MDARETSVRFKTDTQEFELFFLDSGNMREQVERVLTGKEYPPLQLPEHRPATIVDIGANVGMSGMFLHACFPDATIHCYEPSPANFAYLQRNLGARKNFVLHAAGLSDRDETVRLYTGVRQMMQNSVIRSAETTDAFETATLRRASSEFDAQGFRDVGVLKIDTEGCEIPILRDLGIERLRRVDFLYIEYHADEDRRAIDAMLAEDFLLVQGHAPVPHRGMLFYVARRVTERYPEFEVNRLTRGDASASR